MTLGDLFPGRMGRVELTRVAIRIRRPDLLKKPPTATLDDAVLGLLTAAKAQVKKG